MGIRFFCPNGHKLNVKSFLAGKKGVCPQCGARMRIPRESDPTLRKPGDPPPGSSAPESDLDDVSDVEERADVAAQARGAIAPAASSATAVAASVSTTARPATATAPVVGSPATSPLLTPAVSAAPATLPDPIDESPNSVWYVRPPSGGQYGPARGDVMKRWVSEGRVTADSYIWREGWADWKTASSVLPAFRAPATAAGPVPQAALPAAPVYAPSPAPAAPATVFPSAAPAGALLVGTPATASVAPLSASASPAARAAGARRKSPAVAITWIVVLGIMAVILTVALVLVLRSN